MFDAQGLNDMFQLPAHNLIEFIEGQVDAMVTDPALWEVIGADPFRAIATADQRLALIRLLFSRGALLHVFQLGREQ